MIFRRRLTKLWDWALFTGVVIVSAWALLRLPPDRSAIWFGVLILGAVAVAAYQSRARLWPVVEARRAAIIMALAAGATACMALSAYGFRPTAESIVHYRPTPAPKDFYDPFAPWLFAGGALLLSLALALVPGAPTTHARPAARPTRWWRHWPLLPGVILLWLVAEINGGTLGARRLIGVGYDAQFALLAGGIALVAWGLCGAGWPRARWQAVRRRVPWLELGLLLALTAAALGVRLWMLGTDVRVLVDEGHFAFGVTYFWQYDDVRLLEPMQTTASFPFIFSYGMSKAVDLLGRNFWGLRALSAVLGALTIPAIYLLGRALYDRLTGLLAALVLLTFPPHLHYSRLALNNIADPLFGTLGLALLARALRRNRRWEWALGGASLGLTQYFYEGGRLMFPLLAAAWLGVGCILWRPRPPWRGIVIAVVAFVLVAAPIYYTYAGRDFPLIDRLDKTQLNESYWQRDREPDTLTTRLVHLRHALLTVINAPENTLVYYYLYYGGHHPLVLEWLVPALLLGVVIALWQWRTPGSLLAGWALATVLGNAALIESAVSARYVIAFPALALLIALGGRETLRLLRPGWSARWHAAVMIALAVAVMLGQGYYYFGPHLELFQQEVRAHVDRDVEDALLRARAFPPGTHVFIVGDKVLPQLDTQRFIRFLRGRDDLIVEVLTHAAFADVRLDALEADRDAAFFVSPESAFVIERLRAELGLDEPQRSPYDVPPDKEFWLFYWPAPVHERPGRG